MPKKETLSNIKIFYQGGTKLNSDLATSKVEVEKAIASAKLNKSVAKLECVAEEGDQVSEHMYFDPSAATLLFYVITAEVKEEAPALVPSKESGLVIASSVIK